MTLWELKEQAITRVQPGKTRGEWLWCLLKDDQTVEAYRDKQQAINRLDELRTQEYEG